MQKLSRIKSPVLKRAVIGLGLITAFGAGYQLNEAKWRQLAKEPEKKVGELPPVGFRMDEYTPEGVKIADLATIDALPPIRCKTLPALKTKKAGLWPMR